MSGEFRTEIRLTTAEHIKLEETFNTSRPDAHMVLIPLERNFLKQISTAGCAQQGKTDTPPQAKRRRVRIQIANLCLTLS